MRIQDIILDKPEELFEFYGDSIHKSRFSKTDSLKYLFDKIYSIEKTVFGRFVISEEGTIWYVPADSRAMHNSPEKAIQRESKIAGLTGIGGDCIQLTEIKKCKTKDNVYKSRIDSKKLDKFIRFNEFIYDLKNMSDAELVKELISKTSNGSIDISKNHREVIKNLLTYRDKLLEIFEKNLTSENPIPYVVEPESKIDKIIAGFTNRFKTLRNDIGIGGFGHYGSYSNRIFYDSQDDAESNQYLYDIGSLNSLFRVSMFNEFHRQGSIEGLYLSDYNECLNVICNNSNYNISGAIFPFKMNSDSSELTGYSDDDIEENINISVEYIDLATHNDDNRNIIRGSFEASIFDSFGYGNGRRDANRDAIVNCIKLVKNFHEITISENKKGKVKVTLNKKDFGSSKINDEVKTLVKELQDKLNEEGHKCYYDIYHEYATKIKNLSIIEKVIQSKVKKLKNSIEDSEESIERSKKSLKEHKSKLKEEIKEANKYGIKLDLSN